jgi:hypothetical protein
MRVTVIFTFTVIFLVAGQKASAQSQFSAWFTNFSTFKLSNKFSIYFVAQLRSTDKVENVAGLLLFSGLSMHMQKNMTASAGYGFSYGRRNIGGITGFAPEHRLWEQLTVSHPAGAVTFSHRFRFEQRFIAKSVVLNNSLKHQGDVYANRFRYQVRTMVPLGKKLQPKTPYISLQNELLFNFGDKSGVNGEFFDQNRAGLSLGYRVSKPVDLELGYLNQYINGRGDAFTINHIVQLTSYLRL